MTAVVIRGDARALPLPDASVDLICTSPPYFGLRSYSDGGEHYDGQIGSEATPREWLDALLACTAEWVRVLKPSGSIFVNLGDKYAQPGKGERNMQGVGGSIVHKVGAAQANRSACDVSYDGMPGKCLMGLPWRYAIACTDQLGLILRRDIIWSKPNGLPESVTDRCRSSHEYLFHFTARPRYYAAVDEIREPHEPDSARRSLRYGGRLSARSYAAGDRNDADRQTPMGLGGDSLNPLGKLPGSVWHIHAGEPIVRLILRAVADGALTIDEAERLMTEGIEWTGSNGSTPGSSAQTAAGTGSDSWTTKATGRTAAPETGTAVFTGSPTSSGSGPSATGSPLTTSAATGDASILLTSSPSPSGRTSGEDARQPSPAASTATTSPQRTPTSGPTGTGNAGPAYENEHELTGDVWPIPSQPLKVPPELGIDHFAAFPCELPRRIILGWSPPGICTACGEGRRPVRGVDWSKVPHTMTDRRALTDAERLRFAELFCEWQQAQGLAGKEIAELFPSRTGGLTGCVSNWRAGANVLTPEQAQAIEARFGPLPAELVQLVNLTRLVPVADIEDGSGNLLTGRHNRRAKSMAFGEYGAITGYACACPDATAPTRPALVVDPFGGTGTTALVASMHGRTGISVDMSGDYCRLAAWRTADPAERAKALQVPKPPPVPEGQIDLFTYGLIHAAEGVTQDDLEAS